MFSRLFKPLKEKSFFLFGPRGTGKTSWVKTYLPEGKRFDLLDDALYRELLSAPERIETYLKNHPSHQWIILDEVQRIPPLLNHVHRLIESEGYRFVLTGSSARKLKSRGVNLLAGRALTETMHPLTTREVKEAFDLNQALSFGMLPQVFSEKHPSSYLESYVTTYLREEVMQEGIVRNLSNFSRFLESASFSQASLLNISAVARDCGIERKVVESYFQILEDLLIAFRLPVFTKKAKRKLIHQNKFFFFDCGVFQTIRPKGPLDSDTNLFGQALETLFIQEIRALNDYLRWKYDLYFWHTADHKHEVDLVCYGEKGLKAFEIKKTQRLRDEDLEALRLFKKDYPMADVFFIYGGSKAYSRFDIHILPIEEALNNVCTIMETGV